MQIVGVPLETLGIEGMHFLRIQRMTQPAHLVVDQRVERVNHEGPQAWFPTCSVAE